MRRRLKILLPVLIGLMASLPLALAIIFAVDGDGDGDIDLTKPPQEVSVSANGTLTTVTGGGIRDSNCPHPWLRHPMPRSIGSSRQKTLQATS